MSEKIVLRKAIQSDAPAITKVYLTSRKELLAFAPLVHSDESVHQWIRDILIPADQVTVAEENGTIIGMMVLSKQNNIGWIEQLYLLPTATGKGIGSLFVAAAKATLGSPIRLHTFQENINAKHFYERHGFRLIALSDGSTNEEHCPDALYEWRSSTFSSIVDDL